MKYPGLIGGGIVFLLGMVVIAYQANPAWVMLVFATLAGIRLIPKTPGLPLLFLGVFLAGFYGYVSFRTFLRLHVEDVAAAILIERGTLVFLIAALVLTAKLTKTRFSMQLQKPRWNNRIYFPFITHGFHSIPIRLFFLFSVMGSVIGFSFNVFLFGEWDGMKEIVLFALAFSIVNATLEEMLWRGTLFPILAGQVSWMYAFALTSLAFGLHHIALGIPFWAALGFSIGGFFFAIVKWRSESLFPPILWHFIINLLMVFSGFILPN
jgi:uncharacterized protein